jgi:hypothetical protein
MPIADRMCISQNTTIEEISVDPDQALRVQSSAHVVNISFTGTLQPGIVSSAKRIENPCQSIFYSMMMSV